MHDYDITRSVCYSPERMFDLVADIESYPRFVPGYRAVRILSRKEGLLVEQSVGFGAFSFDFRSRAELERPESIRVHTEEGPFPVALIEWSFMAADAGCRVHFGMDYTHHRVSGLLKAGIGPVTGPRMVQAFLDEAKRRYGGGA